MKSSTLTACLALLSTAAGAAFNPHARAAKYKQQVLPHRPFAKTGHGYQPSWLTNKTAPYAVNGSNIPDVAFDIGESYAGTLPISNNTNDGNRLYFWYFPSENPAATDEITIWLNGGPGCSSMDGLLQENGPFLWQSGTYSPIQNPYSWTNLTNMVYVDQPVGTGFSPATNGTPASIVNEEIVAQDFMAFWKNFMDTFDLRGRKVYITGESYAGQYIPYIAYYMLEANDTKYYNVKGIQINDPSINEDSVILEAPAVMALNYYNNIIGLNETFMTAINQLADECGFTDFMEQALQFPPLEQFPTLNLNYSTCDVWDAIVTAAYYVNPCFNIYHLIDFCPYLSDEMGFPSLGWGPNDYFNQTNVQQAINAPPTDYSVCGNADLGLNEGDGSVPSALGPLPYVIERTNNVVIGHGMLDFLLFANGSLATIQNMTWNGMQGFQKRPESKFFVPYHNYLAQETSATDIAGAGYLGITHTERGLTFVTVDHSGHEIPQYVPGAAYRQLEFLLGRISSLTDLGDYTTDPGNYTGTSPLR